MNKILQIYIAGIFLLVSCARKKAKESIFGQVESCIEVCPDSALTLLKQIAHPEDLRGQEQADYALLLTQVYDKLYMDSLQSDSLIGLAAKYYSEKVGERVKAAKAYYYYGAVMTLRKRYPEAMQAYLDAQSFIEGADEYKLQGLIWEHVGYLVSAQGYYEESISHFEKSIKCYKLAGDESGLLYGYKNIVRVYIAMQNNDSARWYANEGLALSDATNKARSSFLQILGLVANENKLYVQAMDYYQSAIKYSNKLNEKYRYTLSLGNTYFEMGQDEKAIDCFKYSRQSTDFFVSSGAYHSLYKVYKKRADYKKAMEYNEISDSLLEMVRNKELQVTILNLQSKYENEKLLSANKQMGLVKEKQMFLYLFLLTLTIGVAIAVLIFLRKKYQKLVLRDVEIIRNNNLTIEKYACKIADLECISMRENEAKKEEIGKLNRKILHLTTENKRILENTNTGALFVLEELKQGRLIAENMTLSEREHLFDFIDLVYENFVTRLKKEFELSKSELLLAVLLKAGFSNKHLADVFACEMKSLYKYRQRLKLSLALDKDISLDQMIMIY